MKIRNDFIRKRLGKRWQIANSAMSDDSLSSPYIIPDSTILINYQSLFLGAKFSLRSGFCEGQLLDKLETHATVGASG